MLAECSFMCTFALRNDKEAEVKEEVKREVKEEVKR
jgi:hypothetical protein